jgi:uncharacterized membrane-anchored protein YhcB (DUF1043 family)
MSGKAGKPTVRDHYRTLKEKVNVLKAKRERVAGKIEEQKKERAKRIKRLGELGVKNPDDEASIKKHMANKSKELLKAIKKTTKEVDDGIAKLDGAETQGEGAG